jgi:methionyl-tRNA formyltransferase
MLRLLILTQNENLFLPRSFARVCEEMGQQVCAIFVAPTMSTHGGAVKGFWRHLRLFGLLNTFRMGWRVLAAKRKARSENPDRSGPFHCLRSVGEAFGVPYHEVEKVNSAEVHELIDQYKPDLLISISCPQIIGKKLRERFPQGCINVHSAPLPRYRGLMPGFWVLRYDEDETAVTVHDLADKLDNGDILLQKTVPIAPDDSWFDLISKTKAAGAEALIESIRQIERGEVDRKPNRDDDATYFSFPGPADRRAFRRAGKRFL